MKFYAILLIFGPLLVLGQYVENVQITEKSGVWQVGNCTLAQFSMNFTLKLPNYNETSNITVKVPHNAKVSSKSTCGDGKSDQTLVLDWTDKALNETEKTVNLERELTISFRKNSTELYYGVVQLFGKFTIAKWEGNSTKDDNKTIEYNSKVTIDSHPIPKIMFRTPLDRSFTCKDIGNFPLFTSMTFYPVPNTPVTLPNTTVNTSELKFDAFRDDGRAIPTGFRTPLDCDYQPNDIVPIAVGVCLAALVIVVLIAYMVGRRRNRQRGYQSV